MYKLITHSIVEEHFDDKPHAYQALQRLTDRVNTPPPTPTPPSKEEDVLEVNVPLMVRLLEYAREDATSDVDLHLVVERMTDLMEDADVLTMDHYPKLVKSNGEHPPAVVVEAPPMTPPMTPPSEPTPVPPVAG